MKHFRPLAAAGFLAAVAVAPAAAADISGAGATFPYPIYAKWADAYKKETGIGLNYQSIGSGGGIKQITEQDRDLRRQRRAAEGRAAREDRPRPVPDGDGRHRAGRQSRRHQAGRTHHRRPDAGQDLPRRDQDLERSGDPEAQSRAPSCRRSRSSSCTARTARARPSTSPTTSRRSARNGSRRSASTPRSSGRSASAPRATKASPTTSPRPRARSATSSMPTRMQNKLTHTKMINKDGKTVDADVRQPSRPRPPMPTGSRQPGYRRDPRQPARRTSRGR